MIMSGRMDEIKRKNTGFLHKVDMMRECLEEVDREYEEKVNRIKSSFKELQKRLDFSESFSEDRLIDELVSFLQKEEYGLEVLLALSGLSRERLFRIISMIRIAFKSGLYPYEEEWLKKDQWRKKNGKEVFSEWKEDTIKKKIKDDYSFARSIVLILLGKNEFVNEALGEFEKPFKLTLSKLKIRDEDILDTLIRSSLYGSYSAKKGGCPEKLIGKIIDSFGLGYGSGKVRHIDRKIDLVIPSVDDPKIFIEIAYVETTSSGMGDKAKTEKDTVREAIKRHYKDATFIVFVDGLGWLSREEALRMMCEAGDYVFTFHPEHIEKFIELLSELKRKYNLQSQSSLTEY